MPTGAVPWTMVPELFLQETRPVAVTVATIVNWAATFLVGFAFPYILVSESMKGTTYTIMWWGTLVSIKFNWQSAPKMALHW